MPTWTQLLSPHRHGKRRRAEPAAFTPDRTPFQVDYDRLVFSSAFRRLHDKTQVFPFPENDLVHSRLTHSLEVACVGRSLGTRVGVELHARGALPAWASPRELGDIVAAACLAHDIGNPPFGHSGEDAIGSWFLGPGTAHVRGLDAAERATLELFEGNAQGFRLLTRLESPANPGLQLTYATLAAFTKYPRGAAPKAGGAGAALVEALGVVGKKHGFHASEAEVFAEVARETGLTPRTVPSAIDAPLAAWARHPLAYLVEAADDICYAILDLEDGVRLGHVPFARARELLEPLAARTVEKHGRTLRAQAEAEDTNDYVGFLRATAIGALVDEAVEAFLAHEPALLAGANVNALPKYGSSAELLDAIKRDTRRLCYEAREVVEIELAGYEVVHHLLDVFVPAVLADAPTARERKLRQLLPAYATRAEARPFERLLAVTDYVSGMTDSYAVSLFRRLRGIELPTKR
jgi:dGTPase